MKWVSAAANQRAWMAAKAILRHIQQENLRPGDPLLPQQELRKVLGFSNDTITSAMATLVKAGALKRKSRVGTIVVDPMVRIGGFWSVGVTTQHQRVMLETPFFSQLVQLLQARLTEGSCRTQAYTPSKNFANTPDLEGFPGLAHDVETGAIDALVTTPWLSKKALDDARSHGVPVVHIGSWGTAPTGVIIDQAPMVREMSAQLQAEGCRRLAVAHQFRIRPDQAKDGPAYWKAFLKATPPNLRAEPAHFDGHHGGGGGGVDAGRIIGQKLLELPADRRPDALIATEDWLAMGLCAALVRCPDYRPRIAVQTNLQAPIAFALPVYRYEVDIEQLVDEAIDMLMLRLLDPQSPDEQRWYAPHRRNEAASNHPLAETGVGLSDAQAS